MNPVDSDVGGVAAWHPSASQQAYFSTFGFIVFRGLFAREIDEISEAFEAAVADDSVPKVVPEPEPVNFHGHRVMLLMVVEQAPGLRWLKSDPRVWAIARSLLGEDVEYTASDGNLFGCDTAWHSDTYGSPLEQPHLKMALYLDELDEHSGAVRVIPGTNHVRSRFATEVRDGLTLPRMSQLRFGVEQTAIPSVTLDSRPGDLLVWSYRTVHGAFNSGPRRRVVSLNFRSPHVD